MAAELRSSTEELDFQDPNEVKRRRSTLQTQQAIIDGVERKDSACSLGDFGFLSISGRQSRLSSIGSGGSAASAGSHYSAASHYSNVSHLSGASHLSAISNISKASRGSSPHRMLVETSFCGPKPPGKHSDGLKDGFDELIKGGGEKGTARNELQVKSNLVGRSHSAGSADHRQRNVEKSESKEHRRHRSVTPKIDDPKTQKFVSLYSEDSVDHESVAAAQNSVKSTIPLFENSDLVKFVSLHGTSTESTSNGPSSPQPVEMPVPVRAPVPIPIPVPSQTSQRIMRTRSPIPVPCPTAPPLKKKEEKKKEEEEPTESDIRYMKPFTNKTLKNFISQRPESGSKQIVMTEEDKNAKHLFISLKEDRIEKLPDFPSTEKSSCGAINIKSIGLQPDSPPGDKKSTVEIDNKTQIFISLHEDPPSWKLTPKRHQQPTTELSSLSAQSRRSRTDIADVESHSRVRSKERDRSRDSRDRSRDRDRDRDKDRTEPLVKIIPLHAGNDDDDEDSNRLRVVNYAAGSEIRSLPSIPLYSLDIDSAAKVYTLDLNNYADSRPARSLSQLRDLSRTPPSPASKNNNFFRRNSESSKGSGAKSDSGSRPRKSSVFGLFKRSNSIKSNKSKSDRSPTIEPCMTNAEFNFKQSQTMRYDNTLDTIIIPLHSPDSVSPGDIPNTRSSAEKSSEILRATAEDCVICLAAEFETVAVTSTPLSTSRHHRRTAESPGGTDAGVLSDDGMREKQDITTTAEIVTQSAYTVGKMKLETARISTISSIERVRDYSFANKVEPAVQREKTVEPTTRRSSDNELSSFKDKVFDRRESNNSSRDMDPDIRKSRRKSEPWRKRKEEEHHNKDAERCRNRRSESKEHHKGQKEDFTEHPQSRRDESVERPKCRRESVEHPRSRRESIERQFSQTDESVEWPRSRRESVEHPKTWDSDSKELSRSRRESAELSRSWAEDPVERPRSRLGSTERPTSQSGDYGERPRSRRESTEHSKNWSEDLGECPRSRLRSTERPTSQSGDPGERPRSRRESAELSRNWADDPVERPRSRLGSIEHPISGNGDSVEKYCSQKEESDGHPRSKKEESRKHSKTQMEESGEEPRSSRDEADDQKSKSSESGSDIGLKMEESCDDLEKKGLMNQPDSLDDELPYVPTTLPQERSVGLPIIPVKQRAGDLVRTCPIDRPRSTTPITPASLDMFVAYSSPVTSPMPTEKMLIVLPGVDLACEKGRLRSPSQTSSWQEFADQGLTSRETRRASSASASPPPPPLPPRMSTFYSNPPSTPITTSISVSTPPATTAAVSAQSQSPAPWVLFDEIAEKRRSPKKITTLPSRHMHHSGGLDNKHGGHHGSHHGDRHGGHHGGHHGDHHGTHHRGHHGSHGGHHHAPDHQGGHGSRSRSRNVSANVNSTSSPSSTNVSADADGGVVYNYVNPEDCSCECHDSRVNLVKKESNTGSS